jgi:hypothetical protein
MSDDLDRLCEDIKARAEAFATEAKRLALEPRTPERRKALAKLRRDMYLALNQIRLLLQTGRVQ